MSNDDLFQKLVQIFKVEAEEYIKKLSDGIFNLEKNQENSDVYIENVLRIAHSLKGSARSVNMFQIVNICQILENIFLAIKKNEVEFSEDLFDMLYQAVDITKALLAGDKSKSVSLSALIRKLNSYIDKSQNEDIKQSNQLKSEIKTDITSKKNESIKSNNDLSNESLSIKNELLFENEIKNNSKINQTIRIDVEKLDSLLLQSEEMINIKLGSNKYIKDIYEINEIINNWQEEQENISESDYFTDNNSDDLKEFIELNYLYTKQLKEKLKNLLDFSRQQNNLIESIVDDLLEDTKKTLMMPFYSILESFPRMVRDIARQQGKKVELDILDSVIEIDKRVLEQIKDCLIHLIRNSIDHGIENPEKRKILGKNEQGTIKISLTQRTNNWVEISINDDGAGIDIVRIKEVAEKNGINTNEMTENELIGLIFKSGFSTSKMLTDLSGRGLGVVIAREKVENLGGAISVKSAMGLGTTFIIRLPITLSTIKGLVFKCGGRFFVLSMKSIESTIRIKEEDIRNIEGNPTILFKEEVIPLISLKELINLPEIKQSKNEQVSLKQIKFFKVIIVSTSSKKIAFYVDEILYEQEITIKKMGKQLLSVPNISGVTYIGSGQIVPVLDAQGLINSSVNMKSNIIIKDDINEIEKEKKVKNILVAEDSITSRTLLKSILEVSGYKVKTTVDGVDAFRALREDNFDLVISDVEMPRMNGFELTEKIRADKKLENTPVILITSLADKDDQQKGMDAGANAYIVKSSFDQNNLLNIIPRLI